MKESTTTMLCAIANIIALAIFGGNHFFIVANIFTATSLICSSIENNKK
jgi:hypothetical protein